MSDSAQPEQQDQRLDAFHLAEYKALADYFGRVITFRFSTAAFFIAAVAIVLGKTDPTLSHYWLLLGVSVGVWIVELRTRSLYMNLIERAQKIESRWVQNFGNDRRNLPFFWHIHPYGFDEGPDPKVPKEALRADLSNILKIPFRAKWASHTVGLDIVYLSVITYALFGIVTNGVSPIPTMSAASPIIGAIVGVLLALVGADLIKSGTTRKEPAHQVVTIATGVLVLVGAAFVIYRTVL